MTCFLCWNHERTRLRVSLAGLVLFLVTWTCQTVVRGRQAGCLGSKREYLNVPVPVTLSDRPLLLYLGCHAQFRIWLLRRSDHVGCLAPASFELEVSCSSFRSFGL